MGIFRRAYPRTYALFLGPGMARILKQFFVMGMAFFISSAWPSASLADLLLPTAAKKIGKNAEIVAFLVRQAEPASQKRDHVSLYWLVMIS